MLFGDVQRSKEWEWKKNRGGLEIRGDNEESWAGIEWSNMTIEDKGM